MKKIQVSHILVQHEYEAKDLLLSLVKGKSFEELAQKFSKCPSAKSGGNLGIITPGKTVEEFEEASFNLKVDEISQPIRTKFGYHLIKRIL